MFDHGVIEATLLDLLSLRGEDEGDEGGSPRF